MVISVDTSQPILRPADFVKLVRAVSAADPADEADWIEWKSYVDLTVAEGRCHAARHILGFSNRQPDRAARTVGGWGYLIIGAEPGRVSGIRPLDPADLDAALRPYVGDEGPLWVAHNVMLDGVDVLVIAVEPSKWGDGINVLRKDFGSNRSGDVFIRRYGSTHKANAVEMDMLQRRFARGQPLRALDIELQLNHEPLDMIHYRASDITAWIEREREKALESLRNSSPRTSPPGINPIILSDPRSASTYEAEVADYLRECRERLPSEVTAAAVQMSIGKISPVLINKTEENFPDVRVALEFSEDIRVAEATFTTAGLPEPPRPFGTPGFELAISSAGLPDLMDLRESDLELEHDSPIHRVTFPAEHLRPGARVRLPHVHLFPRPDRSDSEIHIDWHATSTGVPGVIRGTLQVRVGGQVVTSAELLKRVKRQR